MSEPISPPPGPRPGRGLRIALVASLGLNLLILGAVLGLVLVGSGRVGGGFEARRGLHAIGLGPIVPLLAEEDRDALGARIRGARDRFAAEGAPLARAVSEFAEALRTDPFDRAAAEAALAAQRARGAALQAEGHALLLDQLETMEPEARATLADRMERALDRARDRGYGTRDRDREGRPGRDGDAPQDVPPGDR